LLSEWLSLIVGGGAWPMHWCIESCKCVAACCGVLQCGTVCCSVAQRDAICCSKLPCDLHMDASRHLSVLQCAACCSVLQCVAVWCSVLQYFAVRPTHRCIKSCKCASVCCSVLRCVVVCFSVLQCVAPCCSDAVCCTMLYRGVEERGHSRDVVDNLCVVQCGAGGIYQYMHASFLRSVYVLQQKLKVCFRVCWRVC